MGASVLDGTNHRAAGSLHRHHQHEDRAGVRGRLIAGRVSFCFCRDGLVAPSPSTGFIVATMPLTKEYRRAPPKASRRGCR